MTPFEFVFALISIITSLALTHIVTGVVAIIRHKERGSFSFTHALWVWVDFAVVIGNWGAMWGAGRDLDWSAARVLARFTSLTILYGFCALVIPEVTRGTLLDLKQFHEREGRRYMIAHNVFAGVAILFILALGGATAEGLREAIPPAIAFMLGMTALLTRGRVQLTATILLALLATAFMLINISILDT